MLVEGNVSAVKTFPSVALRQLSHNSSQTRLYEVSCAGRQQLISAGRTRALQYTYLWREPLDQMGMVPEVSVTDLTGGAVASGEANILPHNKTLRIKSSFDGELIISNKSHVVDKRKISLLAQHLADFLERGFLLAAKKKCAVAVARDGVSRILPSC